MIVVTLRIGSLTLLTESCADGRQAHTSMYSLGRLAEMSLGDTL